MNEESDGTRERDAALAAVQDAANQEWLKAADEAVWHAAQVFVLFTSDDVWAILKRRFPNVTTHEPRALGAVMTRWAKAGVIRRTDRVQKSSRPACHRRPLQVWESLVKKKRDDV